MDTKILTVNTLNDKGEGLAFTEGKEVFLDNALPGEVVAVTIGDPFVAGSKRCPGQIERFISASKDRQDPFCPYFKDCGGCQLQHWSYAAQLSYKKEKIKAALSVCGIDLAPQDFAEHSRPLICRYKTIRYFKNGRDGICQGFYKKRSHELIEIEKCVLEPAWFQDFLKDLLYVCNEFKLDAYDETTGSGLMRNVMLRDGGSERLALICMAAPLPQSLTAPLIALAKKYGVSSLSSLVNASSGNKILAAASQVIYGNDYMTAQIGSFNFRVKAHSFLQVNPYATLELYQKAVAWCGRDVNGLALDLCCGVGTMSMFLADKFKKVIGVEIVPNAVAAARENAKLNGKDNVSFIAADLKKALPSLINENVKAVIADPARAGLGLENCKALNRLKAGVKLALIFCSLTALKRDLPVLVKGGWQVKEVQGVDMFPYSTHVETVVLLLKGASNLKKVRANF